MPVRMTGTLVCDVLRMALFARQMPRGVIVHSDRRSQYCSREHRKLLDEHGLIASMSARGNCYDNAAMESWSHSLKVEAIHGDRFATRELAIAHVFEYIEVDYIEPGFTRLWATSARSSLSWPTPLNGVSAEEGQDHFTVGDC
jgi:putative transposase